MLSFIENILILFKIRKSKEQDVYNNLFKRYFNNKPGTFIEIGAFDGISFSKSYNLIKKNWNGIYFEPILINFSKLKKNLKKFNNADFYNLAIGEKEKIVEINKLGPFSTIDKSRYEHFKKFSFTKKEFKKKQTKEKIKQISLDSFLKEKNIKSFDLLIIDVEGYETKVFNGFDLKNIKPKMIIVELHNNNINYEKFIDIDESLENYILSMSYKIVYKDMSDTCFIRVE